MSPQRTSTTQIETSLRQARMTLAASIRGHLLRVEQERLSDATLKVLAHHLGALQTALEVLSAPDPQKPSRGSRSLNEELGLLR